MKNTLTDLHNHLFETLEKLTDPDEPLDVERAKAVCRVADTLIESAKVELQFMELMGKEDNNYIRLRCQKILQEMNASSEMY